MCPNGWTSLLCRLCIVSVITDEQLTPFQNKYILIQQQLGRSTLVVANEISNVKGIVVDRVFVFVILLRQSFS